MSQGPAMPTGLLYLRTHTARTYQIYKKNPNNTLLTLKGLDNWASKMHRMRGGGGIPESERTTGFT
jgi:hypothetical protein